MYLPSYLTRKDRRTQQKNLNKSRKLYKKGIYFNRPAIKSFKSKKSRHITNACKLYNVRSLTPSNELANKTQCNLSTLNKIVKKGVQVTALEADRINLRRHGD